MKVYCNGRVFFVSLKPSLMKMYFLVLWIVWLWWAYFFHFAKHFHQKGRAVTAEHEQGRNLFIEGKRATGKRWNQYRNTPKKNPVINLTKRLSGFCMWRRARVNLRGNFQCSIKVIEDKINITKKILNQWEGHKSIFLKGQLRPTDFKKKEKKKERHRKDVCHMVFWQRQQREMPKSNRVCL